MPLGEEAESYVVRVRKEGMLLREATVGVPRFTYSASERAGDGADGGLTLEVAQVSARFGLGPFERIAFDV